MVQSAKDQLVMYSLKFKVMKSLKKYFLQCAFWILPACYGTEVNAQQVFAHYVSINKNTVLVDNLTILDSVGAENKMLHTAAFDITISNGKNVQQLLQQLSAGMQANKEMDICFSKYNTLQGKITEERFYYSSTLQQIMVPAFNAAVKAAVKLRVFIRGIKTDVVVNPKSEVIIPKADKVSNAMVSNFKLTLGALPTNRVRMLQGMTVMVAAPAPVATAAELSPIDNAAWSQAFNNGAGQSIPEGRIELMSPNLKDVIATIYLYNIRLNAFRSNSGGNTISTVTYGLAVGKISLTKGPM